MERAFRHYKSKRRCAWSNRKVYDDDEFADAFGETFTQLSEAAAIDSFGSVIICLRHKRHADSPISVTDL